MNHVPTPVAPTRPPALTPLAMPGLAAGAAAATPAAPEKPQAEAAPPITEPVPLPPVRVAAVAAAESAPPHPVKYDYGIDLGGASSIDILRTRWAGVKANYGPQLTGLSPVAVRDRRTGSNDYRLVIGPLPNAAAAKQLCARLQMAPASCRIARYDAEAASASAPR
jgi:hypothetical protein